MTALIVESDIENELQISLPTGYTSAIVTGICDDADAELQCRTNRTSFTGLAARRAKRAELLIAIDYLTTSNRDLVKLAISSLSESGTNVQFSNGKTLASYREEAERIINELTIGGAYSNAITFPDISDVHTGTEGSILY